MGFFKKLRIFLSGRGKKNRPAPDTSGEIIKHLVLTVYFLPISTFVVARWWLTVILRLFNCSCLKSAVRRLLTDIRIHSLNFSAWCGFPQHEKSLPISCSGAGACSTYSTLLLVLAHIASIAGSDGYGLLLPVHASSAPSVRSAKNGWTDRDTVWGRRNHVLDRDVPCTSAPRGEYNTAVAMKQITDVC